MTKSLKTISASEFKAKCLKLMDEVAETGEPLMITKNGKPTAKLCPPSGGKIRRKSAYGMHKGKLVDISDFDLTQPVADLIEMSGDEENIFPDR